MQLSKKYFLLLLFFFKLAESCAQLGGAYTIDTSRTATSRNYQTFKSAVSDLLYGKRTDGGKVNGPGISSSVIFHVATDTYYEQLDITPVSGSSPNHTITFQSAAKDSSKVVLLDTNTTLSVNNYTLYLDGADNIIFKKITIRRGGSGNYANVVQIDNEANANAFIGCRILGKPSTSFAYPYSSLIYSVGAYPYSTDSGNVFRNNLMKYGYYGFSWYATSFSPEYNTIIENNIIDSTYYGGINTEYQKDILIRGNIVRNILSPYALGVYTYYTYGGNTVANNKIYLPNGGEGLGVEYNATTAADSYIVANNFVSVGGSPYAGIYAYGGDNVRFYYNNVLIKGLPTYSSYAVSVANAYVTSTHFILKNNNFVNMESGSSSYAVYYNNSAVYASDYNNLYTNGNNIGYYNSAAYSNLAAWRAGSGLDSHSLSVVPGYISDSNLHITNVKLDGQAIPISFLKTDIDGQLRDPAMPDIGADEIFPLNNDAGITAIDSPGTGCNGAHGIYVTLKNFGKKIITGVSIYWQLGAATSSLYKFSGTLKVGADTIIKLGSKLISLSSSGTVTIKAWTSLPNGIVDSINTNDTFSTQIGKGMSGIYTIWSAGSGFKSFNEAVAALMKTGVCGSVVFSVHDGNYPEQVHIGSVTGTSASAQVVFQSQSGDSTKVILNWPATNAYAYGNNYTLSLEGASWITFRKITITRTGVGYYGNNISMVKQASSNSFANCILSSAVTSISSSAFYSQANVIYSTGDNNNANTFRNNSIKGGYYNCYIQGAATAFPDSGNIFDNNVFDSSFSGSLYLKYQNTPVLRNNTFKYVQSSYPYGVTLYYTFGPTKILANNFQMPKGGVPLYMGYGTKGSPGGRILVANNFISLKGSSGYTDAGIFADNSDSADIIYNNILVNDPNSLASALNINSLNSSFRLFNNNLVNTGAGYSIYLPGAGLQASENNNLYCSKGNTGYYAGSLASTLADWKSVTLMDSNSVSVDPDYFSGTDLHIRNTALDGAAMPMAAITTDIDGQQRNKLHPDIGADEIFPLHNDAGIASLDSPNAGFCGGSQNIYVRIRNYGLDTLRSLTISWSVNGFFMSPVHYKGNLQKGKDVLYKLGTISFPGNKASSLKIFSVLPNGIKDSQPLNDTVSRIMNSGLIGTYTIGGKNPQYRSLSDAAADLMSRGLCGATIFNIRNGYYNEQVEIGNVIGVSSAHTVTFQSQSNDSSAVVLDYHASKDLNRNYTLLLNGADHITFKNITISRSGAGLSSNVIELSGESDNNLFINDRIIGIRVPPGNAGSYYYNSALAYSAVSVDNDNHFINNYMKGDFWGIYFLGTDATQTESRSYIIDNVIDSSFAGIFMQYEDSMIVESNTIQNLQGGFYGIQAYYVENGPKIIKNRILMDQGGFGMYVFYFQGTSLSPALIANNIVLVNKPGTGIYSSHSGFAGFYYNTVVMNASGLAADFEGAGAIASIVYNNIFENTGSYPAISAHSSAVTAENYNDYLSKGKVLALWNDTAYSTLKALRKANGMDSRSLNVSPAFRDTISFALSDSSKLIHKGLAISVTDDINGKARNSISPDIGAVENNIHDTDLALVALIYPPSGSCGDSLSRVGIKISNVGLAPLSGFSASCIISGSYSGKLSLVSKTALAPTKDTILFFPAFINTYKGGIFSFKAYISTAGDQDHSNDTLNSVFNINSRLNAPAAKNGNTCGPGSVKLLASSPDSVVWYDSLGNYLQSGDSLRTALLKRTSTYFVQALPKIRNVGLYSPDSGGGYNSSPDFFKGLVFNALTDFRIDSITVYPQQSGTLFINIRDSNGSIVSRSKTYISVATPFAATRIGINVAIARADNYSIDAIGSSIGSLYANGVSSIGKAKFPYVATGIVSIKNNTDSSGAAGGYCYFYNWKISSEAKCPSPFAPVKAVVGSGSKPVAAFGAQISCNGTANFIDSSYSSITPINKYSLEFGDSATYSDTAFISVLHHYGSKGLYRALLSISTTGGCTDSLSKWINIRPQLRAAFSVSSSCLGDSIRIIDSSYSAIPVYFHHWDFGNGDTSGLTLPKYKYDSAGKYTIHLRLTSALCADTLSRKITVYSLPVAGFSFKGQCLGDTTIFSNLSSSRDSISRFTWTINSGVSHIANPYYVFNNPATFSVTLAAQTLHGCKSAITKNIIIYPRPNAHFSYIDTGHIFSFNAADTLLKSYVWDFGDSTFFNKGPHPQHAYVHLSKYTVMLSVRDSNSCTNTYDTIIMPPNMGIAGISNDLSSSLYPNPFYDNIYLSYTLQTSRFVKIGIYSPDGKTIADMEQGIQAPGSHSMNISAEKYGITVKGLYFLKLEIGGSSAWFKLIKL